MMHDSHHEEQNLPLNPAADSLPLKHVVICCTSVPDEKRTELGKWAQQMGAIHRYDLTLDTTHLIVGEYNTPKYRYVAKERPDVRPMSMAWIDAVRALWIEDRDMDVAALEKEHLLPTFHTLKFSMTGCDDPTERLKISEQVKANGAIYEGDLTKQITHLISFRTEGAKYRAAKTWGLRIVSVEWLRDSLERGMILDETLYDPVLPPAERGKGAWDRTKPKKLSLGKRSRDESSDAVETKRKLRRVASNKLASQNDEIWGTITGGGNVLQVERSGQWGVADETPNLPTPTSEPQDSPEPTLVNALEPPSVKGIFSGCRFYFHGFPEKKTQIMSSHLLPHGAEIAVDVNGLSSPSNSAIRLFRVVPHDLPVSEHPDLPPGHNTQTVTSWYVEQCLHRKMSEDPREQIIGRPFPRFPIPEFKLMVISTAGFAGIDLLHVSRAVQLIGGTYSQTFSKQSSILLTKSTVGLRRDKMKLAGELQIPIVDAKWLWDSIEAGERLSTQQYRFRGSKSSSVAAMSDKPVTKAPEAQVSERDLYSKSSNLSSNTTRPPQKSRLDTTAFITDEPNECEEPTAVDDSETTIKPEIESQKKDPLLSDSSHPLSERNANSPSRTISTAPAPSDHPNPVLKEDISTAISSLLRASKTKHVAAASETEGRKRGRILGRATSNISAASTPFSRAGSVESSTHTDALPSNPNPNLNTKEQSQARRTANEKIEEFIRNSKLQEEEGEEERPSTQLQYEDPESAAYKEKVMARMLGRKVEEGRRGAKERAPTIADGPVGGERLRRRRTGGGGGGLR